jgi:large subunit ribosomal protein L24
VSKFKKGQKVLVITGNNKGKTSQIVKVIPKAQKVVLEDLNVVKRHKRPTQGQEKGEIVTFSAPISWSNVKVIENVELNKSTSSKSSSKRSVKSKEVVG